MAGLRALFRATAYIGSVLVTLVAAHAEADPRFSKQTVAHEYAGGWEHFVGGGIASFDCDGDDLPELFVAGGENPSILLRNESAEAELSFRVETPQTLSLTAVTGAYPLDVDSDGYTDLIVLRVGQNRIFRGGADCTFTPLPFESASKWTTSFAATWEAGRALPTLAFGNYVDRTNPDGPFGTCDTNTLYRPDRESWKRMDLSPGHCALSILFSDWGRQGRADLRVSNDRHYYVRGGSEQMWAMETEPHLYSEAEGWLDQSIWGMGIASRDITGDGLPEVYLTSMGDQKLQYPTGEGPGYEDARFEVGHTAHRPYAGGDGRPSTGWHAAFADFDNDGRDDIFVAKGNVEQMPSNAADDPNNLLMQQADGTFAEAGEVAGLASMVRGRGAVVVDLNNDGLLDIAVNNRRAPLEIYQNVSSHTGGWISVSLSQDAPNVDAIGAFIEVETKAGIQTREITVGGGHASGSLGPQHFGLGDERDARVRVIWPDGQASNWQNVGRDTRVSIRRDELPIARPAVRSAPPRERRADRDFQLHR